MPDVELQDRILSKVIRNADGSGCWHWTGRKHYKGYGKLSVKNKDSFAHRVSYTAFVGPIPSGLTIDHLCRVRDCVNPDHLEPVTNRENLMRGVSANRTKTHCPQGHEYTPENTRTFRSKRYCRECKTSRLPRAA